MSLNWTDPGLTSTGMCACFAQNGSYIFAGTKLGVFKSSDNGVSWSSANTGLFAVTQSLLAVGSSLYVGTATSGVYVSTNNGASWTSTNSGISASNITALAADGTSLYAGTGPAGGVFKSTNGGTLWSAVNTGLTNLTVNALLVVGSSIFAGTGGGGIFVSTNGGTSWSAANTGLSNSTVLALTYDGSSILYAGTSGGGVFVSTNGGTSWSVANSGLSNLMVQSMLADGTNVFAATLGGVFLSQNNAASWSVQNTGLSNTDTKGFIENSGYIHVGVYASGAIPVAYRSLLPVPPPPVQANFSADAVFGFDSLTVHFTDLSLGSPTTWAWNLGNGQTSTTQNTVGTYSSGVYTVTLVASNPQSTSTIVKTAFITVVASPTTPIRYYVGSGASSWDSSSSWSLVSGGASGASVPGALNTAVFDRTGYGVCTMHSPVSVAGLDIGSTDTTLVQNNTSIAISGTLSMAAGYFNGSGQNICVSGGATIGSDCVFKSTDATLQLYSTSYLGTGFNPHSGTVAVYSGAHLAADATLCNLEILRAPVATPIVIDNTCVVSRSLTLGSGYLQGGPVMVSGDLYVQQEFGSFDNRNTALINMDGTAKQNIYNQGGVIPNLTVNKDTTFQTVCWGTSPLLISGNLLLQDGTFNTQGIDLQVGI